jgi:hypothetical protein
MECIAYWNIGTWCILLWPRWDFGHAVFPRDGEFKGQIFESWYTPLFEIRKMKDVIGDKNGGKTV